MGWSWGEILPPPPNPFKTHTCKLLPLSISLVKENLGSERDVVAPQTGLMSSLCHGFTAFVSAEDHAKAGNAAALAWGFLLLYIPVCIYRAISRFIYSVIAGGWVILFCLNNAIHFEKQMSLLLLFICWEPWVTGTWVGFLSYLGGGYISLAQEKNWSVSWVVQPNQDFPALPLAAALWNFVHGHHQAFMSVRGICYGEGVELITLWSLGTDGRQDTKSLTSGLIFTC